MKLKSIEREAKDCLKALNGLKVGDLVNFCHHEIPLEILIEPPENRIKYIFECKNDNIALRLRLFRPAKIPVGDKTFNGVLAKLGKVGTKLDKIRAKLGKAGVELDKARSNYIYSHSELLKDRVKWSKAKYKYRKTSSELWKTKIEYEEVCAKLNKAYLLHFESLFGVKWRGSIFDTFLL